MLGWNINRPRISRIMERLEVGEEVIVVEKNLFNQKNTDTDETGERDIDFHRVTFVWLPEYLYYLNRENISCIY